MQNCMEWVTLMKLDFKRYLMAVLFAVMPVIILSKVIYVELDWASLTVTIIAVILFISLLYIKNKYVRIATIVAGLLLLLFTNNFGDLLEGIKVISKRYGSLMDKYKSGEDVELAIEEIKCVSTVIRFYLEIMIPSLFVVYKNKLWKMVYIDVTVPFVVLVLAVGLTPTTFDIYMLTFMYVNMAMEKTYKKGEMNLNSGVSQAVKNIYVNIILLVVFLIITSVNAANPYERDKKLDEYKAELNSYLSGEKSIIDSIKAAFNFGSDDVGTGGMNNGVLGSVDEIKFTGEEKLEVTLWKNELFDKKQTIYIKSYVGAIYTGDSWKSADNDINEAVKGIGENYDFNMTEVDESTATLLKYADNYRIGDYLWGETERIQITNLNKKDKNVYWPYYCNTGLNSTSDGQRENTDESDTWEYKIYSPYTIPCTEDWEFYVDVWDQYPGGVEIYHEKLSTAEDVLFDYNRDVASKYYLEIPESFEDTAKKILNTDLADYLNPIEYGQYDYSKKVSEINVNKLGYEIPVDFVKKYLYANCEYSLSPGKLQSGEDFVDKFLNETKIGYCSHFASAATLMFRAMGIPARYVEGYVVRGSDWDDDDKAVLKDDAAHAWVEIFVKGIGWVPVDVTPSYYTKVIRESINNGSSPTKSTEEKTTKEEITTTPAPTVEETTDVTTAPEETTANATNITTDSRNEGDTGGGGNSQNTGGTNNKSRTNAVVMLGCILIVVTIITSICMIYANAKKQQQKYQNIINGNDKDKIYNTFLEQLKNLMQLKKIDLNLFESTKVIKEKIMKADPKLREEYANQIAEVIVKCQYSEEPIEDTKLKEMVSNIGKMSKHIYNDSGFIRKLNLYYIKCLYLSKK